MQRLYAHAHITLLTLHYKNNFASRCTPFVAGNRFRFNKCIITTNGMFIVTLSCRTAFAYCSSVAFLRREGDYRGLR
jgi:hypothetical protein